MRITKKAVIRAWIEQQRPERVGAAEAAAIRREIARVLAPDVRISEEYLLAVLDELGVAVDTALRGISPELFRSLHFGTLEAAEATLRLLDGRYRSASTSGEPKAAEECRRAAMLVRSRAERIARGRKVDPRKRAEKEEIARWFTIWLQTPGLFFDWLEIRRATQEFQKLFTTGNSDE